MPNSTEYVTFPSPSWAKYPSDDFYYHEAVWKDDGAMRGCGCKITLKDIADGRVPQKLKTYNQSLEQVRLKYGFPRKVVEDAARKEWDYSQL